MLNFIALILITQKDETAMRSKILDIVKYIVLVVLLSIILQAATTYFSGVTQAANDPITPDHPLWTVPQGTAVIDGVLNDTDWQGAFKIVRTQAWRDDGIITIRMMYSSSGIYLSAEVDDENLWADGTGSGAGNRWEVETDDSVTFYFDPDKSRDEFFSDGDRAFGVNLGNPSDPVNGAGTVRRWKYVKGTGDGGAPDVIPGGNPATGTLWATTVNGTVNNSADTDTGWVTEIFLPWDALNMGTPTHGQAIGMNFDIIFDNDGGTRNLTDNRNGPQRFVLPAFVDDHVQGAHSSYNSTQAGIHGPVNYAEVMFIDESTSTRPSAITDLLVNRTSAYGAHLHFTAPTGTIDGKGHVSSYEIRYSISDIMDETSWASATTFENSYVPRLAGFTETLRIAKLSPSTTYYIAVRGRDALSNLGVLGNSVSITTSAKSGPSDLGRIIPTPNGSVLMFEDGTPFVPVGENMGLSWGYYRNLYPGDVWDPINNKFQNFNAEPSFEGPVGPHLDKLVANGVNTLRLYLEVLDLDQTGNPENPRGRYWIEFPAGTFNPDMKQAVLNLLKEVAERDIYLIIAPNDTGRYDEVFTEETPWYTGNGGPLSDINDFFQNPQTIVMAKARMREVMNWVEESPHSNHLLGWDPMSEWDTPEWTMNSEGNSEPGRETEMRRRAQWIIELNNYIREQDPDHLLLNSTTVLDPRGPVARVLFYDRATDVLAPHFYTNSSEEPINNPDSDKKVMPAIENELLTSYWLTHCIDQRPTINDEWGMTRVDWPDQTPRYSSLYTQVEDEAQYQTISWSGLASGQLNPGLRIAADELMFNLMSLTDVMRDVELTISRFIRSSTLNLDFANLAPRTLAGNISASSTGHVLLAWGVTDGKQGLAYVLQDGNKTSGSVTDGQLVINGLDPGQTVDVEFWSTSGAATSAVTSLTNQSVVGGTLTLNMPTFMEDIAVKFKGNPVIITNPAPNIKANGSDGPVTPIDNLSVTVALDPGSRSGDNADWWVAENISGTSTIDGWYYFDLNAFGFVPVGDSPFDLLVTHQGPLFNLPMFEILNMPVSGLPSGTYTFYFAVDTNMNGSLDFGELFFDFVVVNITP